MPLSRYLEEMTKEEIVVQFASDQLSDLQRESDGTAFDHALRVAEYIREVLMIDDTDTYICALLHDLFEDTEVDQEVFLYVFGEEVYRALLDLTRAEVKVTNNMDRMRKKIEHNLRLMESAFTTRIVKCADKVDNMNDALSISKGSRKYSRIPYWVVETKYSIYPLARMTHKRVFEDLKEIVEEIESTFSREVSEIEERYLIGSNEMVASDLKLMDRSV